MTPGSKRPRLHAADAYRRRSQTSTSCCSSRWRNLHSVVAFGTGSLPGRCRQGEQRVGVVQRLFAGQVWQIEPVLQQVDAQHALQPDGRAAVTGLGQ